MFRTWWRHQAPRIRRVGAGLVTFATAKLIDLDARDWAILLGLVLLWVGLRDVYRPAAPIAVGCFLLWFTTIRRVPS